MSKGTVTDVKEPVPVKAVAVAFTDRWNARFAEADPDKNPITPKDITLLKRMIDVEYRRHVRKNRLNKLASRGA